MFFDWFKSHDPFTKSENVMSISTGVIGDKQINCHLAYEIGIESMSNVIGSNFGQVKFQRKNRVMPLRQGSGTCGSGAACGSLDNYQYRYIRKI